MSFDFSTANLDREFPVRRNLVYLNHAAAAPLPRRVADAMIAHVENARDRGVADWRRAYGDVEKTRAKAARFIGAAPAEIAFLPNTSWAVNLVASSGSRGAAATTSSPTTWSSRRTPTPGARSSAAASSAASRAAATAASRSTRSRRSSTRARASSPSPGSPSTTASSSRSKRSAPSAASAASCSSSTRSRDSDSLPMDVGAARRRRARRRRPQVALRPGGRRRVLRRRKRARARSRDRRPAGGTSRRRATTSTTAPTPYEGARRYEPGTLPIDHVRGLSAAIDLLEEIGTEACPRARPRTRARAGGRPGGTRLDASPRRNPSPPGSSPPVRPDGRRSSDGRRPSKQRGVIVAPRERAVRFSPHAGNDEGEIARALAEIDAIP